MEEEVNLADRTNFDYQMLIGRSFLSGNVLIDPSLQYSFEPNCTDEEEVDETNSQVPEKTDLDSDVHVSEKLPYQFKSKSPKVDLTKPVPTATPTATNE